MIRYHVLSGEQSQLEFDYVIVGGGTAGAVIGARLSENPDLQVAVIEAGPDDRQFDEVLKLKRWLELLESDLDYKYTTQAQPRGNSHIVHSRAKVLGGCSSHNTMIWFKPLPGDWDDWVAQGAAGWEGAQMEQYYAKLPNKHQIVPEQDRDPILPDWIESAVAATGVDYVAVGALTHSARVLDIGADLRPLTAPEEDR